jgi:tetratricopeptide (TPR) repeat protein
MRLPFVRFVLAATLAALPCRALAQHEHEHMHEAPERLGKVHFPTSCDPAQQPAIERAVALLHSFAYAEAATAFREVAAKDPACAMAQWGIAMSYFHVIWGPPTPGEFAAGKAAADQAVSLAARASARDRDFVGAIAAYYQGDGIPHAARVAAFERAMSDVAQRHPDDHEAQIFYALSILGVAYNSPPDKTYARQKHAAEILNRMLALEPEHPGISHYMIHAFDYPDLASLALPAARAYAKIAPSAPHALHMPSHIFTRLGMWRESIESNIASAKTAQAWIARTHPGATAFEALHAMDYLEYAYLQTGQDGLAAALVDTVGRVTSSDSVAFQAGYALAAIPARFALERRSWKDAARLEPRPASFPWDRYPYAEALVHFARAVGAARSGDLETAGRAIARLEAIQQGLQGQKGFDWATQVEIQQRAAEAWLARARKQDQDALRLMRAAADLEDGTDKHPVTPGSLLPAREQLGDLLLELGQPDSALVAYEASLRSAPARFNSYLGAERAARRAGQEEKAKHYHELLATMCGGVVPSRAPSE